MHDWVAIATWVVVAGHILFALGDRGSLRGMLTGRVSGAWAERHHPLWAGEIAAQPDPAGAGADERVGERVDEPVERPLR